MTYLQSRPFHAYLVCCVLACYSLACFSIRPFASSLWKCVNAWGWPWRVVAVPLNPSLKPLWRVSSSTLLENCPPRMVRSPVAARHTLAPNTCTHSVTVRLCSCCLMFRCVVFSFVCQTHPITCIVVAAAWVTVVGVADMCPMYLSARTRARFKTMAGGQLVNIHPTSVMFGRSPLPECIVFNELVVTSKSYMRAVSAAELSWLPELAPHCFKVVSGGGGSMSVGIASPPPSS
mgnify:CR=1 FL=1